jgi:hypothetical protein
MQFYCGIGSSHTIFLVLLIDIPAIFASGIFFYYRCLKGVFNISDINIYLAFSLKGHVFDRVKVCLKIVALYPEPFEFSDHICSELGGRMQM